MGYRLTQERIVLLIATALLLFFAATLNGFPAPENLLSLVQNVSILGVGMAAFQAISALAVVSICVYTASRTGG